MGQKDLIYALRMYIIRIPYVP